MVGWLGLAWDIFNGNPSWAVVFLYLAWGKMWGREGANGKV